MPIRFSESFKTNLKELLWKKFGLTIMRGQIVLDMHSLSKLTSRDYIRICSLEAVAEEISAKCVEGSVCELGVYKGDFAKHINSAFPERDLYLFDTFEGFSDKDKTVDIEAGFSSATEDFSDTSLEAVMHKMKYPNKVIARVGYFPESIQHDDEAQSFAFVSIDADLFQPIYSGLHFFYPRLSKGGYIFVHDYNNTEYPGVKAAVRKYCNEVGTNLFPLVDPCGTAIITKG